MTNPRPRSKRTIRISAEMADWVRAYRDATGQSVYGSLIQALEEFRDEVGPFDMDGPAVTPENPRSIEGRTLIALELPQDLHRWLRVYSAVTGRRGESIVEEALTKHRARIEAREPCRHG